MGTIEITRRPDGQERLCGLYRADSRVPAVNSAQGLRDVQTFGKQVRCEQLDGSRTQRGNTCLPIGSICCHLLRPKQAEEQDSHRLLRTRHLKAPSPLLIVARPADGGRNPVWNESFKLQVTNEKDVVFKARRPKMLSPRSLAS